MEMADIHRGPSFCCMPSETYGRNGVTTRETKRKPMEMADIHRGHSFCCMPSETYGRNGVTPIFRSFSQNCQFHHRRLESLEHFNVLYISFTALRSHFRGYHIMLTSSPLFFIFVNISIFFRKYTLHVCYVSNVI